MKPTSRMIEIVFVPRAILSLTLLFLALSLLPTHAGKIKCIYIDPPYNTGNEGWVYNDNVSSPEIRRWLGQLVGKESEDLSRHDKWLCMMYPRLRLTTELLAQGGGGERSVDLAANLERVLQHVVVLPAHVATRPLGEPEVQSYISHFGVPFIFNFSYCIKRTLSRQDDPRGHHTASIENPIMFRQL